MAKKVCNHCFQEKDETEFNWRWKALGIRNSSCKQCQHAHNKKYYEGLAKEKHLKQVRERTEAAREAARAYVYQYLLKHLCIQCGETDPRVLEFHHVGEKGYRRRLRNVRFCARIATVGLRVKREAGFVEESGRSFEPYWAHISIYDLPHCSVAFCVNESGLHLQN